MLKAIASAATVTILAAISATPAPAAPPMAQPKTTISVNSVQVQFNEPRRAHRGGIAATRLAGATVTRPVTIAATPTAHPIGAHVDVSSSVRCGFAHNG